MSMTLIPEFVVPGKRLGRHIDTRTAAHRETGGPPPLAKSVVSVQHQSFGLPLDQGQIGSRTANALCGALNTRPHYMSNAKPLPRTAEPDAVKLYRGRRRTKGSHNPPNDPGGTGQSVRSRDRTRTVLRLPGRAGLTESLLALVLRPVITGVNWYDSFEPRPGWARCDLTGRAGPRRPRNRRCRDRRSGQDDWSLELVGDHLG